MSLMDIKLLNRIAPAIEGAINTALAMDPVAQKHLKRMKDCILAINISSPKAVLYVGVEEQIKSPEESEQLPVFRVSLLSRQDASSVQIKGSLLSFIKLANAKDKSTLFRNQELQLSGDSVRIQQIQAFLSVVSVDWEGILATVIGDIPAHLIGTSIRQGLSFGLNLSQSLIRDAEEFIKYELRLFPNKAVAKKQFAAIDKLYSATEKLERKIKSRLKESTQRDLFEEKAHTTD